MPADLESTLNELMALPAETEWVEFKEAKNNEGQKRNFIKNLLQAFTQRSFRQ